MNIKTIVKYALIILGLYIFVYIPLNNLVLNPPQQDFRYTVLEKRTGSYTESTGKYSSRTTNATFIRIRDENGYEETLTITDPYVSDDYVVGNTYVKHLSIDQVSGLAFFICVIDAAVIIVFLLGCFFITLIWLSGDRSWVDCFNNPLNF